MSAKKLEETETLPMLFAPIAPTVCADMRILGSAATVARNVKCCTGKGHKIGCKRKGRVDFAVQHPRIAKS
jgi:hypothetical protein